MSDDAPVVQGTEPPAADATGGEKQDRTFTQGELDRIVGERLGREREKFSDYDDLKQRAEKLAEIEAEKQTDLERLTTERDGLKEKLTPLETDNLRLRVALEKKLPGPLIDRLKGGTKEEMEGDADELMKLVGPKEQEPAPGFDGGPRTPAPEQKSPEQAHNDFVSGLLRGREPS